MIIKLAFYFRILLINCNYLLDTSKEHSPSPRDISGRVVHYPVLESDLEMLRGKPQLSRSGSQ